MKTTTLTIAVLALAVAGCGDSNPRPRAPVAPSIDPVSTQSLSANVTAAPITFRAEGEGALSFSVSSDTQAVIADDDIVVAPTPSGGTLLVTPVPDMLGDAMLTIIVSDSAGLSDSASFLVTVVPQQLSFRDFSRTQFALPTTAEPALINAIAFDEDAAGDDFADLLTP